ncbi:hypothetical protein GJ496_000912 [Pomphorhynchus laevis]|nr:hypothetical protein GJ496_000912 [Pomphorhynchus laevis]
MNTIQQKLSEIEVTYDSDIAQHECQYEQLSANKECLSQKLLSLVLDSKAQLSAISETDQLEFSPDNLNSIKHIRFLSAYLRCYQNFLQSRKGIENLLDVKSYRAALNMFQLMVVEYCEIASSKCHNIVKCARQLCVEVDSLIETSLISKMCDVLDMLHFPFTAKDNYAYIKANSLQGLIFIKCFNDVLQYIRRHKKLVNLVRNYTDRDLRIYNNAISYQRNQINPVIKAIVYHIELKFKYHFCLNKSTNRLDKPQWYLQQLVSWLVGSIPLIKDFVCTDNNEVDDRDSIIVS